MAASQTLQATSRRLFAGILIAFLLLLPAAAFGQGSSKSFGAGAYIIDMGAEPQTVENGLKPYGLVYQLLIVEGVPVHWAINPSKGKDEADFTAGGKSYKAGSFIIPAERVTDKVLAKLKTWKAKGVVVDGPLASGFTAPIQKQLTSWPRAILDEQNDKLVVPFYSNAEVPVSSYVTAGNPTMLTNCGDVYVLPHADPQDWTTSSGYFAALRKFVTENGYLWSACHAVSALESIPNGNFLSESGLVLWNAHDKGTPPYTYAAATDADPVMQFLGSMDAATQNGSEQIFLPKSGGWRKSTTIAVSDPDHPETGSGKASPGPAAVLAYGRAYGDSRMGMVMEQGGHDLNAGSVEARVAAQRAYFNFILLAGVHKAIAIVEPVFPDSLVGGKNYTMTVSASGGVGTISYQWSSDCGGTFSNPKGATTVFKAPSKAGKCVLKVEVSDQCGRLNFSSVVSNIVPGDGNDDPPIDTIPPPVLVEKRTLDVFVTFANGSKSDPGTGKDRTPDFDVSFPNVIVAVDKSGNPIKGTTDGKCTNCQVGSNGVFIGPIINLAVTGPVHYLLTIYSTLGEFIGRAEGRVSEDDLPLLDSETVGDKDGERVRYLQRIIWTARSQDGQRVGSGAYILHAELRYPADAAKGIRASTETYLKRFGHVR